MPGSIPGWGVCDFFRFCQSFTSNFPFPLSLPLSFPSSSFPFLFLSLRPFIKKKKKSAFLHRKYEEIASATDGSHPWWTLAKQFAKISTPHLAIPDLCADENVATTDFEKATLLANYFASQCTSIAPPEHLKGAPFPPPEKQPIFDFLPIPELTVQRTVQHLPISKATAHPLITNRVLRECAPIICPSITHLFNIWLF